MERKKKNGVNKKEKSKKIRKKNVNGRWVSKKKKKSPHSYRVSKKKKNLDQCLYQPIPEEGYKIEGRTQLELAISVTVCMTSSKTIIPM